jgi:hypothetical protein
MLALSPAMYVARFSYDVLPVSREGAGTHPRDRITLTPYSLPQIEG